MAAKTATAAFDVSARTSDRRGGGGCRPSPLLGWEARGTPWSTPSRSVPSCRFLMCLWRTWGTRWWNSCRRSTRSHSSSGLLPCPRSLWTVSDCHLHPDVLAGAFFPSARRRRNSWWKCRNSCRLPFCSSSRSLTFLEVLGVFSLDRIICWCGSRS